MADLLAVALLLAAQAPPDYAVAPFAAPPRLEEERQAIQFLIVNELAAAGARATRTRGDPCSEAGCAASIARATQALIVVVGNLQPFGRKILVSASVYEAGRGMRPERHDLTVDTADDLDVAAKRIAAAIIDEGDTEQNQALGAITDLETEPDRRRQGRAGFALSMGAVLPIDDTYATSDSGVGFGVGYWYEGRNYALETSIGFRFSADTTGERRFYEVPVDIGAYYILGLGDFAPFIGGGGGLRYLYESRPGTIVVGNVIQTVNEGRISDDAFGFGGFLRAGVILLRTYTARVSISGRYAINFFKLNGADFPQAGLFEVQVHF